MYFMFSYSQIWTGFGWKRPCKGKYCYNGYSGRLGGNYRGDFGGYSGVIPFGRGGVGYSTLTYGGSAYGASGFFDELNMAFGGAFVGRLNSRNGNRICNSWPCKLHYANVLGGPRRYGGLGDYRSLGYMYRSSNLYGAGDNLGFYRGYSDLGSGRYGGRGIIGRYSMRGVNGREGRTAAAATYSGTGAIGEYNRNGAYYDKNNQNEGNSRYGTTVAMSGYKRTRAISDINDVNGDERAGLNAGFIGSRGPGDYYSRNGANVGYIGSRTVAGYAGNTAAVAEYGGNTAIGGYRGLEAFTGPSGSAAFPGRNTAGAIGRNIDIAGTAALGRGAVAMAGYSRTGDNAGNDVFNGNNDNNDNSN